MVNPKRNDGHIGSCPNGDGISLIKEEDMKSATFDNGPGEYSSEIIMQFTQETKDGLS